MKYILIIKILFMVFSVQGAEKPYENTIGNWEIEKSDEVLSPLKFDKIETGIIKEIEISNDKIEIMAEKCKIAPVSTIFIRSDKYCWAACVWMYDPNDPFVSQQFQLILGFDGNTLNIMQMIDGKKTNVRYRLTKKNK